MSQSTRPDTRAALIRMAGSLLRSKGYSAFSYADLAEAVGIRKASIHYHFPTKEDLGLAVVHAHVAHAMQACDRIRREHPSVAGRLIAFADWFADSARAGSLPLCGVLAAEMAVLPPRLQDGTRHFFRIQLQWLQAVLEAGIANEELAADVDVHACARQFLGLLEGASFIGWALGEQEAVDTHALLRLVGIRSDHSKRSE